MKTAVNGLLRNAPNGNPDYIQSGADNTLRGIAMFNALRSASRDNPLGAARANVVADPLVGPVAAHASNSPGFGPQYDVVRNIVQGGLDDVATRGCPIAIRSGPSAHLSSVRHPCNAAEVAPPRARLPTP